MHQAAAILGKVLVSIIPLGLMALNLTPMKFSVPNNVIIITFIMCSFFTKPKLSSRATCMTDKCDNFWHEIMTCNGGEMMSYY